MYNHSLVQDKIAILSRNKQLLSPKDPCIQKLKRGIRGLVNGFSIAAIADSGADGNFITAVFAKERSLKIEGSPNNFKLGNSTWVKSLGKFHSMFSQQIFLRL